MDQKRPRGREKNVTEGGSGVHKRGDGLGTGPVGSSNGYGHSSSGKQNQNYGQKSSGGGSSKGILGGGGLLAVIIFLVVQFMGGGSGGISGILGSLLGGSSSLSQSSSSLPSGYASGASDSAVNASYTNYDKSVAAGSRGKYTSILGDGKDTVTIMVYMCGTDLESRNGMASSDLAEMAKADLGNINIIVYTGGCKSWQTSGISNSKNQIFKVQKGGITKLAEENAKVMTDPATLSAFIKWAAKEYPANRNELIFWDHGGGSVSGYGYDEKYPNSGSMNLAGIHKALNAGGVKFDFVGFDACLMATAETALMMNSHADYMIASEETEPGIGWYYTNWLTKFAANTSLSTLEVGKMIVDDFVSTCATQCRGQKTTLSVIDLAEFANTVPDKLTAFSKSISGMIKESDYKTVSDARYQTREFATSSRIDQVDFVDLCKNVNNAEAQELSKVLKSAVKYNKTSSNMTDAYGVSIYFPYQRASYVDQMCNTYEDIGMDESYAACIKEFANLEVSGQVASGGSSSPASSLFDLFGSMAGGSSSSATSSDAIGELLGAFLDGSSSSGNSAMGTIGNLLISGLSGRNINFMNEAELSTKEAASYIAQNKFNASALNWSKQSDGSATLTLQEEQWALVHALDLNMFFDDGEGYVDLGLDNVYDFTEDGSLIASGDRTWLSINSQPVAYYHEDTIEDGNKYTITGRVPAMLNGSRVNLILVFDNDHPYGYVAGARTDYLESSAHAQAKNIAEISAGDKIDFLCDYYSYDGEYKDSYYLGEQLTVGSQGASSLTISNTDVGGKVKVTYRFTDIYNQEYWTPSLEY